MDVGSVDTQGRSTCFRRTSGLRSREALDRVAATTIANLTACETSVEHDGQVGGR
jgi:hypothetical protein